ncbi:MAG: glycosyltransferase [Candidatus Omnitrophica bacterium]|nr:glycosyltransferase [Candidatus Omnitrophota bacterium]MDD5775321.1 glycosyltransferase [Candidatus Omnitrophota bacterium]
MIKISVVIVHFGRDELLFDCLCSISKQDTPPDELIIVDNSSRQTGAAPLPRTGCAVTTIRNSHNRGFSAAANQGIRSSSGDYVVVMNSDVTLACGFMSAIGPASSDAVCQKTGAFACLIVDRRHRVDSKGLYLTFLRRFVDMYRGKPYRQGDGSAGRVFGASGACAVYRRDFLEAVKIGGEYFDEDFFLMVEDVDLAWRSQLLGWQMRHDPRLMCYHHGGISHERNALSQYYAFRNRYCMIIKNEGAFGLIRLMFFSWIYDIPRFVWVLMTNPYAVPALADMIRLIPVMVRKRNLLHRKMLMLRSI